MLYGSTGGGGGFVGRAAGLGPLGPSLSAVSGTVREQVSSLPRGKERAHQPLQYSSLSAKQTQQQHYKFGDGTKWLLKKLAPATPSKEGGTNGSGPASRLVNPGAMDPGAMDPTDNIYSAGLDVSTQMQERPTVSSLTSWWCGVESVDLSVLIGSHVHYERRLHVILQMLGVTA